MPALSSATDPYACGLMCLYARFHTWLCDSLSLWAKNLLWQVGVFQTTDSNLMKDWYQKFSVYEWKFNNLDFCLPRQLLYALLMCVNMAASLKLSTFVQSVWKVGPYMLWAEPDVFIWTLLWFVHLLNPNGAIVLEGGKNRKPTLHVAPDSFVETKMLQSAARRLRLGFRVRVRIRIKVCPVAGMVNVRVKSSGINYADEGSPQR